ncbi:MAG: glycosyltransferase family 4 protein [Jiangellaceae bacterium]
MRIAVVNNFFPPRVGGSAHLSDALARGYAKAGHEVLVLTAAYGDAPADEVCDGVRIVRLPAAMIPQTRLSVSFDIAFTMRPGARRRVYALLDEFGPDVVHQHGQFFDLTWMSGLWARSRRVPALLSIHTRLENPKAHYHGVFGVLDRTMVKPLMWAHQPRLVVMDVQMDEYVKARYRGAYSGLDYIPVGVDPSRATGGDGVAVRARHDLGDAPVILSVGHVIPLRDRVALVEALPAVLAENPRVKLVVVGTVYYDVFLKRARELGIDHAVLVVGAVPKDEIRDYLAAASVEAHDLQGYGLGTASLESMAAGVPVIAAVRSDNFPGIDMDNGDNIVLVRREDQVAIARALLDLIADPASGRRIGAAAAELVHEHFSIDTVVGQHLEVLERMRDLADARDRTRRGAARV